MYCGLISEDDGSDSVDVGCVGDGDLDVRLKCCKLASVTESGSSVWELRRRESLEYRCEREAIVRGVDMKRNPTY